MKQYKKSSMTEKYCFKKYNIGSAPKDQAGGGGEWHYYVMFYNKRKFAEDSSLVLFFKNNSIKKCTFRGKIYNVEYRCADYFSNPWIVVSIYDDAICIEDNSLLAKLEKEIF